MSQSKSNFPSDRTKENLIVKRKSSSFDLAAVEDSQTLIDRIKSLNDELQKNDEYLENLKWTLDQTRMIKTMAIKKLTLLAYEKREILCTSSSKSSNFFDDCSIKKKDNEKLMADQDTTSMLESQLDSQRKLAIREKREESLKFHALLCQYYKKLRDLDVEIGRLDDETLKLRMKNEKYNEEKKKVDKERSKKRDAKKNDVDVGQFSCMIYK